MTKNVLEFRSYKYGKAYTSEPFIARFLTSFEMTNTIFPHNSNAVKCTSGLFPNTISGITIIIIKGIVITNPWSNFSIDRKIVFIRHEFFHNFIQADLSVVRSTVLMGFDNLQNWDVKKTKTIKFTEKTFL